MNGLDLLYMVAGAGASPWLLRKKRSGWRERLGHVEQMIGERGAGGRPRLVLHAVSVGEVNALRPLVPLLVPESEVVVSTTTDTGLARARELFSGTCAVVRYPLDFSWSVRRFLDRVRPDAVALVELELWPNFVRACSARGVPVCVINGRLSERSIKGYERLRRWLEPVFASLEFAAVQDATYAARFERMGVPPGACLITGSMKWDTVDFESGREARERAAAALGESFGIDPARPLVVAGSTGPGEEVLILEAWHRVRERVPGVQFACAPRKPERFDEAARELSPCVRRSVTREGVEPDGRAPGAERFLLDTIGELGVLYALADVVVVGRTFGGLGGSDPIEPIALGRPTIVGPSVENFASIVGVFDEAGAIVRTDAGGLADAMASLLTDRVRAAELSRRGLETVRAQRGGGARHAELLLSLAGAGSSEGVPASRGGGYDLHSAGAEPPTR